MTILKHPQAVTLTTRRGVDPTPLSELAFQHISDRILQGKYGPGDVLHNRHFADELGVSLNPVREAILRLRDIGLVEVSPARYTKVADFSAAESRASIGYAGSLAGLALKNSLPTQPSRTRKKLAAAATKIISAENRPDATAAFLSAVAALVPHPPQGRHLTEVALLAYCALRFSALTSSDADSSLTPVVTTLSDALQTGNREIAETTVCALFTILQGN
ncbi:GntR family transcriptional regulator [Microbacterium sp. Leaf320]|uniref:GntR family transcriptional regulator n=1 Tax=Microbacterium sp. Leaf320 TaxID=1736334 RepID=UPI0006F5C50B|nr:GntR family transcriptional regulator [Microbacterium sp. Leaf320]KQQ62664.1 hypothetical protein ASF63_18045 [Microbacterium sp. Leaf320]